MIAWALHLIWRCYAKEIIIGLKVAGFIVLGYIVIMGVISSFAVVIYSTFHLLTWVGTWGWP